MLLPHEINKKEFTHAIGGYARGEVKSYLEYVAVNYEKLRRENDELSRKLDAACAKLDEYQRKEAEAETMAKIRSVDEILERNACDAQTDLSVKDVEKRISEIRCGTLLSLQNEIEKISRELLMLEELVSGNAEISENTETEEIENIEEIEGIEAEEIEEIDTAEKTEGIEPDEEPEINIIIEEDEEKGEDDKVWGDILDVLTEQVMAMEIADAEPDVSAAELDPAYVTEPEVVGIEEYDEDFDGNSDVNIAVDDSEDTEIEYEEDISDDRDEIVDADEISTDEDITVEDFTDLLILDGGDEEDTLDDYAEDVEDTEDVENAEADDVADGGDGGDGGDEIIADEIIAEDEEITEEIVYIGGDGEEYPEVTAEESIDSSETVAEASMYELYSAPEGELVNVLPEDPEPVFDEPELEKVFEESLGDEEVSIEDEADDAEAETDEESDFEPEQLSLEDIMNAAEEELEEEFDEIDEIDEIDKIEEEFEEIEEIDEIEEIEETVDAEETAETAEIDELEPDLDDIMDLIEGAVTSDIAEKTEEAITGAYPKRVYRFRRGRKTQTAPQNDEAESLLEALKRQYQSEEESKANEAEDGDDEDFDIRDYDEFDFTFADTDTKIETVPTEYDRNDF